MSKPFASVLVANRGEIAVRVIRTLRAMGIRSIAVYSDADADGAHVRAADSAVRIGPSSASASYLSVDAVITAAHRTGAEAIHPGYGFLSENPALARACDDAGIVFVGPPASAIEAMGDKIAAKAMVSAAGVSVVPGSDGRGLDDAALAAAACAVGLPVLIKPSAGGGGKGMRLIEAADELAPAITSARREARGAFGDDTLLVERFVTNPRHIEIQVLADAHGTVVHLGERECSLQRRHQKIIEEAPSPLLTAEVRAAMGSQAVDAARACGYVGAGTVEFIVSSDRPDEFFFMEMNTRLQVEHPVTELVYGIDLVEQQLRIAAGEELPRGQEDLAPRGHAIEARVYAEDPDHDFVPTAGTVVALEEPTGEGVRVDSGIAVGSVVGSEYDPLLAKIVAWDHGREAALDRLDRALGDTAILGVRTNVGFLRRLLALPDVRAGRLDTGLVERELENLAGRDVPVAVLVAAALEPLVDARTRPDPWDRLVGWRQHGNAPIPHDLDVAGHGRHRLWTLPVDGGQTWEVHLDEPDPDTDRALVVTIATDPEQHVHVAVDGEASTLSWARAGTTLHLSIGGEGWAVTEADEDTGNRLSSTDADGSVRSPMPGTLLQLDVAEGSLVAAGQVVAIVEAMKMEHALRAPFDGTVVEIHAAAGATVALDQRIVTIHADDSTEDEGGTR